MSLELEIKSLTEAVKALTLAMGAQVFVSDVPDADVKCADAEHERRVVDAKARETAAHVPLKPLALVPIEKPVKKAAPAAEEVQAVAFTYEDVKKRILAVSAKSRDKAVGLLAGFDATSGPKLLEKDYAEFVRAADVILASMV